jgi:hypothetical protein
MSAAIGKRLAAIRKRRRLSQGERAAAMVAERKANNPPKP